MNFAVDREKNIKQGKGEDAPAVSENGILIICDGTGATGQSVHVLPDGTTATSARLGARRVSEVTKKYLEDHYEEITESVNDADRLKSLIQQLGDCIRDGLDEYATNNNLQLTVMGRSFKLLPTTLAAAVYKVYDDHIDVVALSAGDSRVLLWEPDKGLHQLSVDDVAAGYDAFSDTSNTDNCVSARNDFKINYVVHRTENLKCIIFATSDGFTDPIKPFEQECFLLSWVGQCTGILDGENNNLSNAIGNALVGMGFTGKDDCSIAGDIIGYNSDEEIEVSIRNRFETAKAIMDKYRGLNKESRELTASYQNSERTRQMTLSSVKNKIETTLLNSADLLLAANYDKNPDVYKFLSKQPCINAEIQSIHKEVEEKKNRFEEKKNAAEEKRQNSFLELIKAVCRESIRFGKNVPKLPQEVVFALERDTRFDMNDLYREYTNKINDVQRLGELNERTAQNFDFDSAKNKTAEIIGTLAQIDKIRIASQKDEETIANYFTMENLGNYYKQSNCVEEIKRYIDKEYKPGMRLFSRQDREPEKQDSYNTLCDKITVFDIADREVKSIENEMSRMDISSGERSRRYTDVIRRNKNALLEEILKDDSVFSYFAGMSKEDYKAGLSSCGVSREDVEAKIRQKNDLWRESYKPDYEWFATKAKKAVYITYSR